VAVSTKSFNSLKSDMHVKSVYKFTSFVTFNTQTFSTKTNPLVRNMVVICREEHKANTSVISSMCKKRTKFWNAKAVERIMTAVL